MINARELRIGNLIYENTIDLENGNMVDVIITVEPNSISQCYQRTNSFKPIELTEDILIKCGFIRDGISDDEIWQKWYDVSCFKIIKGTTDYYIIPCYPTCRIKYLHQLQNLYYALTGKELEIKNL